MAASIQGVYVALFGRPADPTGLAYFNGVTKNGADLTAIGDLASTQEYKDRFAGQNNTQIVNSIYQSLFGRDAEAAGLTFFVNALNTGSLNINNIAIAILDGAQGSDKTTVENKVKAADLYTSHLDTAQEIGSYIGNAAAAQGRAFLSGVSTTVPSEAAVDAAILAMQAAGAAGNTINVDSASATGGALTTLDLTTGYGTPAVTTTNNNDTINVTKNANDWDPTAAKIDGGLGIDTVNALLNGAVGAVQVDGLKNVEVLNVSTVTGGVSLDVENAGQLTQISHVANAGLAATNEDLMLTGVAQSVTFGLKGDLGAAVDDVTFVDADASSSLNLKFDAAKTTGSLTVSDAGTITIANTGASNVAALISETKSIVVNGDGSLTFKATDTVLQTLNASAFTGNLSVDVTANDALKTLTSGSGTDTIKVGLTHTADLKIDTGAGADTINVVAEALVTKALTLHGGDGADTFVMGATGGLALNNVLNVAVVPGTPTNADITKSLITIDDFNKAQDSIKIASIGAGAVSDDRATLSVSDLETIKAVTTTDGILAAATKAAELANTNSGAGKVAVFIWDNAAYIYQDTDSSGTFNTTDMLVKVAGVTDVADFTASNFVLFH